MFKQLLKPFKYTPFYSVYSLKRKRWETKSNKIDKGDKQQQQRNVTTPFHSVWVLQQHSNSVMSLECPPKHV